MAVPSARTPQGHEIQFGTNHVGHALLTHLLLPLLLRTAALPAADVRIVNLTSMGHRMAPGPEGIILDQERLARDYAPWPRYGQSKLANILFTQGLRRRYPQIVSVAVHPGVILTDLYQSQRQSNVFVKYGIKALGGLVMGDVKEGAKNQLWACVAPRGELMAGAAEGKGVYWVPVGSKGWGSKFVGDEALADRLWEWTQGEFKKFGY